MKKNYKSNPVFVIYLFKNRNRIAVFFSIVSLSFIRSFVSSTICLCILFISVYFHQVSYIFFSSLLCDNNSSKFVNIWRYLHIMKWNKFQCEKQFSVSFWQIYTIHTYTAHRAHIQQTSKSVKGNLLCAWNLFLRSFVFLCIFLFLAKKKLKRKRLSVISLIDTDNGKQHWTETPDCHEFSVFVSLVLSVRSSAFVFFSSRSDGWFAISTLHSEYERSRC